MRVADIHSVLFSRPLTATCRILRTCTAIAVAVAVVMKLLLRTAPVQVVGLLVAVVVSTSTPFVALWSSRHAIDSVVTVVHGIGRAHASAGASPISVEIWILALVLAAAVRMLAPEIARYYMRLLEGRVQLALERAASQSARDSELECLPSRWEVNLSTVGAEKCTGLVETAIWATADGLVLFCCAILLARFNLSACAYVVLAIVPLLLLELRGFRKVYREKATRRGGALDSLAINSYGRFLNDERCLREIRFFGSEHIFRRRHIDELGSRIRLNERKLREHLWPALLLTAIAALSYLMSYSTIVEMALNDLCTAGQMAFFFGIVRRASRSSHALVEGTTGLGKYAAFGLRFVRHVNRRQPSEPRLAVHSTRRQEKGIRLINVGALNPAAPGWTCRNISLFIGEGERVAFVGRAGTGKSILLQVIAGMRRPDEGSVLIDGVDIREWPPQALRARLSFKFQEPARFVATLRENVALSELESVSDEMRAERSLMRSGGSVLLNELPAALSTKLETRPRLGFPTGGQQWHVIAMARCLFREKADILLIDDPVVTHEAREENRIWVQAALAVDRPTIVVATDRGGVMRGAARLVWLEHGQVMADGRPETVGSIPDFPFRAAIEHAAKQKKREFRERRQDEYIARA